MHVNVKMAPKSRSIGRLSRIARRRTENVSKNISEGTEMVLWTCLMEKQTFFFLCFCVRDCKPNVTKRQCLPTELNWFPLAPLKVMWCKLCAYFHFSSVSFHNNKSRWFKTMKSVSLSPQSRKLDLSICVDWYSTCYHYCQWTVIL